MITIGQIVDSDVVNDVLNFGLTEMPVYARVGEELYQISLIERGQIQTASGPHDILIVDVDSAAKTGVESL